MSLKAASLVLFAATAWAQQPTATADLRLAAAEARAAAEATRAEVCAARFEALKRELAAAQPDAGKINLLQAKIVELENQIMRQGETIKRITLERDACRRKSNQLKLALAVAISLGISLGVK